MRHFYRPSFVVLLVGTNGFRFNPLPGLPLEHRHRSNGLAIPIVDDNESQGLRVFLTEIWRRNY